MRMLPHGAWDLADDGGRQNAGGAKPGPRQFLILWQTPRPFRLPLTVRLLLVEDDPMIGAAVAEGLRSEPAHAPSTPGRRIRRCCWTSACPGATA